MVEHFKNEDGTINFDKFKEKIICIKYLKINDSEFIEGKTYRRGQVIGQVIAELFTNGDYIYMETVENYFITLGEYREIRINKILNDK